mgnify:FL=1
MDIKRIHENKDNYVLNKIEKNIENILGSSILHVYKNSNIYEKYLKRLDEIYKIGFPVLFIKEYGYKNYEYIECLYKYLSLPLGNYKWLIPNFSGSNWWIELKINNICNFIDFYFHDNNKINLTVFDMVNNLLFDIENGEDAYEYRIIYLDC